MNKTLTKLYSNIKCDMETLEIVLPQKWDKLGLSNEYIKIIMKKI